MYMCSIEHIVILNESYLLLVLFPQLSSGSAFFVTYSFNSGGLREAGRKE